MAVPVQTEQEKQRKKSIKYNTDREVRKMNKKIVEAMKNFAIRTLNGDGDIHPQEVAILPEVLKLLKDLPEDNTESKEPDILEKINSVIRCECKKIKDTPDCRKRIENYKKSIRWYSPELANYIEKQMLAILNLNN